VEKARLATDPNMIFTWGRVFICVEKEKQKAKRITCFWTGHRPFSFLYPSVFLQAWFLLGGWVAGVRLLLESILVSRVVFFFL